MSYDRESGEKSVTIDKLIVLLQTLPPTYRVLPNAVGNLAVHDGEYFVAYIDFAEEKVYKV